MGTSHIEVTNQDYGGRYQEVDKHFLTVNSQYNPIKTSENLQNIRQSASNFVQDQKSMPKLNKDGPQGGGLYFGLLQDGSKAISNFLLESQAKEVIEALQKEEAEARGKINVIAMTKAKKHYIIEIVFSTLWLIYFLYSLFLTLYDMVTIDKIDWYQAKNISTSYGGYKATIVTHSYQKGNIQIARQYGYFTQGLTVWSWGIDKKAHNVDVSFYVKKKDYEKVINNSPSYQSVWFSNKKKADTIPFFGLREINQSPNKILLFFDLLKYNYSIILGLLLFFMPTIITTVFKQNIDVKDATKSRYLYMIIIIFSAVFFMRFLI